MGSKRNEKSNGNDKEDNVRANLKISEESHPRDSAESPFNRKQLAGPRLDAACERILTKCRTVLERAKCILDDNVRNGLLTETSVYFSLRANDSFDDCFETDEEENQ